MGAPLEFRVLGPLEVVADGETVRVGGPRPRAVLGVLLAHAGRPVSQERLVDQLWGDNPPPTASAALQVHVSALRKVLGGRLVTAPSGYLLEADPDEVDALRFEALVAAGRRHLGERPATAAADLGIALGLWRGEPYGGVDAGSDVAAARQRLTELRLSTVEDRLDAELTLGRHAQVVAALAGLVTDHPRRERLVGLHMLALYRCGRAADARAAFRALCEAFGTEPGAEITALARAIDRGDPTLDPPSRIPTPPSRFIGRRRELGQLADILEEARLLTLVGPGGAGKTRLALELARDIAADYRDGVYVVELAALAPDSDLAERVATVFGVTAHAGERLIETLAKRLRSARALIVLDNCEHLLARSGALASELLFYCEGMRFLATSREPLGMLGERVWPLAGLTVPGSTDSAAAAARSEAVRLLLDRGVAARPGFTIHPGNIAEAARLTRRLDGLPLAIELAAAQLRTLSLPEVAERLGRALDLADRRARTTPDRHRTMRAAIDWGYHLLAADEQELFSALSVFAGGCRAEDAERVTGASPELLVRLVDRSMLTAEQQPDGTRYRMLELVREYAGERLAESGDTPELRRRHAEWCADLAGAAAQFGPEYPAWLRRLTEEVPNIGAGVAWCLGEGRDPVLALRITVPLWWFWSEQGLTGQARDTLRWALAAADEVPPALYARTLRAAASLARYTLDYDDARELGERSVAAYRSLGDLAAAAGALNGVSITALVQHDFAAALAMADEARTLAEQAGDELQHAASLTSYGSALRALRFPAAASAAFLEARSRFRAINERRGEADALSNLAMMARRGGDLARSRELAMEGLAMCRETGSVLDQLMLISRVAAVELDAGQPDAALRLLAVTARERERLGSPLLTPDEVGEEESTWAAARSALGDRADEIIAWAADLPLRAVVDDLLADPKLTGDG